MNILKKIFGPIYPVILSAFTLFVIFNLSRIILCIWQWPRVESFDNILNIFSGSLRVDMSSICYALILPAFLSCFLLTSNRIGGIFKIILRLYLTLLILAVLFLEVTTIPFIQEYDLRPNRLFIEYLVYPKEVVSMLITGYKLEIFLCSLIMALMIYLLVFYKKGGLIGKLLQGNFKLHFVKRFILAFFVLAFGILGCRASLEHRPLNPALVAFSTDALLNDLTLNSAYSLGFAAMQMSDEVSAIKLYPKMAEGEVIANVKALSNVSEDNFIKEYGPMWAYREASFKGEPKNIVILLLESHGAQFVKSLGGIDASPNIDKFINEGWAMTNLYATGTRSVRGIEAVTTGFTPTPARAVVKLGKSQHDFFTIADLLAKRGYVTQFIYGGESHFDNMKTFFLGNGFNDIKDLPTFEKTSFIGSWGACDEDLYNKADSEFTRMHKEGKKFMSLVFSSSNHTPFEYPKGGFTPYNSPDATVENSVKYADYALGKFIEKAKKSEYWQDTVFVIVADHDARAYGNFEVPIEHFHIPAIFMGGDIKKRQDNRLASQIDIAPTLLSLAGISAITPMIGHDLTLDIPEDKLRALMQRDKYFAYMNSKGEIVLLRPQDSKIGTFKYNKEKHEVTQATLSPKIVDKGHAIGLWGSLSYMNNWYQAKDSYEKK